MSLRLILSLNGLVWSQPVCSRSFHKFIHSRSASRNVPSWTVPRPVQSTIHYLPWLLCQALACILLWVCWSHIPVTNCSIVQNSNRRSFCLRTVSFLCRSSINILCAYTVPFSEWVVDWMNKQNEWRKERKKEGKNEWRNERRKDWRK
jgi:hypothetical protein